MDHQKLDLYILLEEHNLEQRVKDQLKELLKNKIILLCIQMKDNQQENHLLKEIIQENLHIKENLLENHH